MVGDLVLCGSYTDPSLQAGFQVTPERPVMGMVGPTGSVGLYVFRRDPGTGGLTPLGSSEPVVNPSFLVLDRAGRFVFAVSEVQEFRGQPRGAVYSFALDAETGGLSLLSQVSSGGSNPCHLSLSSDERFLFVANHEGGSLAVVPVSEDGVLGEPVDVHVDEAVDDRKPHAHYVQPDPAGRFILSTNTTTDRISVFQQDPASGRLASNDPPWASTHPGGSPRHLAFTPSGDFVLANGEADLTLSLFRYDSNRGRLEHIHHASTVPDGSDVRGHSTAQMLVHPDGRHVYVANRGTDTIAIFELDETRGVLNRVGLELDLRQDTAQLPDRPERVSPLCREPEQQQHRMLRDRSGERSAQPSWTRCDGAGTDMHPVHVAEGERHNAECGT